MAGTDDGDQRRHFAPPYNARNPVPTISQYREELEERHEQALNTENVSEAGLPSSVDDKGAAPGQEQSRNQTQEQQTEDQQQVQDNEGNSGMVDTSQVDPGALDPQKRMKSQHKTWERADRVVTDPVTHLPVTIHDFTDESLREVDIDSASPEKDESEQEDDSSAKRLHRDTRRLHQEHQELSYRFPPPEFDALRQQLAQVTTTGVTAGLLGTLSLMTGAFIMSRFLRRDSAALSSLGRLASVGLISAGLGAACLWTFSVKEWISNRFRKIFDDQLWDAQRREVERDAEKHEKETTVWLNSLIGSVWPLINPDLFASVGDTLEDVMQASLPTFVRMVSVEDIGQGNEALRILGVRWLPAGAATESVAHDGSIVSGTKVDATNTESIQDGDVEIKEVMQAEEGEFINLEMAFAYRPRSTAGSVHARSKDMHLCLAFYLPGNIRLPVWVDLHGIVGIMRMRLQLTPDPPFFEICTLTFLGQPKVELSCTPLTKHGLNIMDVPFISNFVQASIDAAASQYVAPRSLQLNLKDMLAGEDFKKDTRAEGVLVVNIKKAHGFRMADAGVPLMSEASSDPYVSVGWAKFGKAVWSTRIMAAEMHPRWDETCFIPVTPDELNAEESLRVQLWDSDLFNTDDDLGRVEVDLKSLMTNQESRERMCNRVDNLRDPKPGHQAPGSLEWSVGYFPKAMLQEDQYEHQTYDTEIRSAEQLRSKVAERCDRKLREAIVKGEQDKKREGELEQLKVQEMKQTEDAMIMAAPPPRDYPSGIFSIQIHNITGLELARQSKDQSNMTEEANDEEETGAGLPSAYCSIILNHRKTYKTRTKPQNSKPFYNAGCERFIGDWRECEAYVAVRDSRLSEEDPLLGVVHLPLYEVFRERSQVMGTWPLAGGIGHGKIRLSMVWRSVRMHVPRSLLGWEYGTVEIQPTITSTGLDKRLLSSKIRLRTRIGMGKMYPSKDGQGWHAKHDQAIRMPVFRRYSSCMSISFHHNSTLFGDNASAFCVLWLKDLVDDEEQEMELTVWKGDFRRATMNVLEEAGDKLGTVRVKVTFCAGLGPAHSEWASKSRNLRDVVEVVTVAQESRNVDVSAPHSRSGSGDHHLIAAETDSSDGEDDHHHEGVHHDDESHKSEGSNVQGPIDKAQAYTKRAEGVHRHHRGIMQWKIPRTAKWVKHRVDDVGDRVSGMFDRHGRHAGIETEV